MKLDTFSYIAPMFTNNFEICSFSTHPPFFPDISNVLNSNFPQLLSRKLESLHLSFVTISDISGLVNALTFPQSGLIMLELNSCKIASNLYKELTIAIANSELKRFVSFTIPIENEVGKSMANMLTITKTLEEVKIFDNFSNDDTVTLLVDAMKNSTVKRLCLPLCCQQTVLDMSYPNGRVMFSN